MAKKTRAVRHLLCRQGRYFARLAVPENLREIVGKRELLAPLGPDRADAIVRLHGAVDRFHKILADARKGVAPAPLPVSIAHAVHDHYRSELRLDDFARFTSADVQRPAAYNQLFAGVYLHNLRKIARGVLSQDDIEGGFVEATIGWGIDQATAGKARPARGSKPWLDLARALASAQVESIERSQERDRGDFKGKPDFELLTVPPPSPELETAPVSINGLFDLYIAHLARSGQGKEAAKRWPPVFKSLVAYLKHDDARRITKADLNGWVETLHATKALKTIKDVYLASIKAVLTHAFDKDLIPTNPAQSVKIKLGRTEQNREKGFTRAEAVEILNASRTYKPKHSDNPGTRESERLVAAKQWAPMLCAYSGARIAEITQLRKEDIREEGGITFMRLTPEAGSIKTRHYRDVPLHSALIDAGFLAFVKASSDGPLFFQENLDRVGATHPSKFVSGRISQWLRTLKIVPEDVSPNHGWRHTFKTIARDCEIDSVVSDAITGHATRTAGDAYGSVRLETKAKAMNRFPAFM